MQKSWGAGIDGTHDSLRCRTDDGCMQHVCRQWICKKKTTEGPAFVRMSEAVQRKQQGQRYKCTLSSRHSWSLIPPSSPFFAPRSWAKMSRNGGSTSPRIRPDPLFTPNVIGQAPLLLFLSDLQLFFTLVLPRIIHVFLPLRSLRSLFDDITPMGLAFQLFLTLYSVILIVPLILLGVFVGGITPIFVAWALAYPFQLLQGSALAQLPPRQSPVRGAFAHSSSSSSSSNGSANRRRNQPSADYYPRAQNGEAWFFINGIATTRSGLLLNLHRFEQLFQRPVIGILNRSMGTILDLLECVIQRDVSQFTRDVRHGYVELRAALEARNTDKVVLMAHSQGCIIASLIIDLLLATVSRDRLDKLEVYTFASASNHFSNPLNVLGKPTIRHVEHYANSLDPVAQFGVLLFATNAQKYAAKSEGNPTEFASDDADCTALSFDDDEGLIAFHKDGGVAMRRGADGDTDAQKATKKGTLNHGDRSDRSSLPKVHSAAGQHFGGRLFVRWNKGGHFLVNH